MKRIDYLEPGNPDRTVRWSTDGTETPEFRGENMHRQTRQSSLRADFGENFETSPQMMIQDLSIYSLIKQSNPHNSEESNLKLKLLYFWHNLRFLDTQTFSTKYDRIAGLANSLNTIKSCSFNSTTNELAVLVSRESGDELRFLNLETEKTRVLHLGMIFENGRFDFVSTRDMVADCFVVGGLENGIYCIVISAMKESGLSRIDRSDVVRVISKQELEPLLSAPKIPALYAEASPDSMKIASICTLKSKITFTHIFSQQLETYSLSTGGDPCDHIRWAPVSNKLVGWRSQPNCTNLYVCCTNNRTCQKVPVIGEKGDSIKAVEWDSTWNYIACFLVPSKTVILLRNDYWDNTTLASTGTKFICIRKINLSHSISAEIVDASFNLGSEIQASELSLLYKREGQSSIYLERFSFNLHSPIANSSGCAEVKSLTSDKFRLPLRSGYLLLSSELSEISTMLSQPLKYRIIQ